MSQFSTSWTTKEHFFGFSSASGNIFSTLCKYCNIQFAIITLRKTFALGFCALTCVFDCASSNLKYENTHVPVVW